MGRRDLRRHHLEGIKARERRKLLRLLGWDYLTPLQIGRHAATPALCSCRMCGNPRRYFGEVSRQEQFAERSLLLQLREIEDSPPRRSVAR